MFTKWVFKIFAVRQLLVSHTTFWACGFLYSTLKGPVGSHVCKWVFKTSYRFLGEWVPILNPKKSQWEIMSASRFKILIPLFGRVGSYTRPWKEPLCHFFRHMHSHVGPGKVPVENHVRKWVFKIFTPLLDVWVAILEPKESRGKSCLPVGLPIFIPPFGRVSSHARPWKGPWKVTSTSRSSNFHTTFACMASILDPKKSGGKSRPQVGLQIFIPLSRCVGSHTKP